AQSQLAATAARALAMSDLSGSVVGWHFAKARVATATSTKSPSSIEATRASHIGTPQRDPSGHGQCRCGGPRPCPRQATRGKCQEEDVSTPPLATPAYTRNHRHDHHWTRGPREASSIR